MTANIINLTPHEVKVFGADGTVKMTVPASGAVARCEEIVATERHWSGFPLRRVEYGPVTGLPDADEADCPYCGQIGGVTQFDSTCGEHGPAMATARTFLVSALVRQACPKRKDLVSPGRLLRDPKGQPIGCEGLVEN